MAFSPVKTAKKIGIGLEAFVDGARSRFTSVVETGLAGSIGAAAGALFGIATMALMSGNALDDFIDEEAKYESLKLYTSFPDQCDFDENYYFAQKGPDNKYGLYAGGNGHYEPLNESEAADFVDDYDSCMQALRMLPKLQQDLTLQLGYTISQPLRRINTSDGDTVNWRELDRPSGSGGVRLSDTQVEAGADGDVVSAFEKTWSDAISDFEDGKVYDHENDKNVTTFTYQNGYVSLNYNYILYGALGIGCIAGLGMGFSRKPSEDYKERGQTRDARRTALEHDNFKF